MSAAEPRTSFITSFLRWVGFLSYALTLLDLASHVFPTLLYCSSVLGLCINIGKASLFLKSTCRPMKISRQVLATDMPVATICRRFPSSKRAACWESVKSALQFTRQDLPLLACALAPSATWPGTNFGLCESSFGTVCCARYIPSCAACGLFKNV